MSGPAPGPAASGPGGGASPLPEDVARTLRRRLAEVQAAHRFPSVSGAVCRDGALAFTHAVGDPPPPEPHVQFRIGSITKTFTAVLVLQLRDEGRLRLDDPLDSHVPGTPFGDRTVRDLLGHLSGLTREPAGDFWEASPGVPAEELLSGLRSAEAVLPSRRAFHYSNLAYGLLGLVVARLRGSPFDEALHARLLRPLALDRTTYLAVPPAATGFRVHPHADVLREEPAPDTGAMAPAGQLWSTPADLVRFGAFLADPDPAVLAPDTLDEMCEPVAMRDPSRWTSGYGLGLQLFRRGDRVLVGHGGSMPGFVAGLAVARADRVAVALCGNAWAGGPLPDVAVDTAVAVLEADPPSPAPWRPGTAPADALDLTGSWYYRGAPVTVSWRGGRLCLAVGGAAGERAEPFTPAGPDVFRGLADMNRGERLTVERDEDGRPVVLDVATWRLTRTPDDPRGGP
jgi:CubicO group peptidase (beta-lactamase class C family)